MKGLIFAWTLVALTFAHSIDKSTYNCVNLDFDNVRLSSPYLTNPNQKSPTSGPFFIPFLPVLLPAQETLLTFIQFQSQFGHNQSHTPAPCYSHFDEPGFSVLLLPIFPVGLSYVLEDS